MKKYIILITALVFSTSTVLLAQNRILKQVMELKMPKTVDDDMPGTRGAGVCWNPVSKKYYAAFCGNMAYPLAVFDATGKRISDDDLTAMQDLRGIWYNAAANRIMANCYSENGWISYDLSQGGLPINYKTKYEGMNQPTEQCVGSYDNKLNQVFFLNGSMVIRYSAGNAKANPVAVDSVQIHWGRKKVDGAGEDEFSDVTNENYNYTNVIATNIPGSEIAVLNTNLYQIELYNIKDGFLRQTLKLPETAKAEPSFNFAYSNGIYWLFDMEKRTWIGCK